MVSDVQELHSWRIDLSVLQLLEEKKLKKSDFIMTENYHLRLKPATAKMLIEKIWLNMDMKMPYKHGKQFTYQTILLDCVQELANFIIGRRIDFQLNIPPMKIRRSDPLELRRKILAFSPNERKRLGLNKSTLWYQKKKIADGKRVKVYSKVAAKLN